MTAPLRREARGRSTGAPALGYPRAARTIFRARGGCPLVRDNAPVPGARDAGHRKFSRSDSTSPAVKAARSMDLSLDCSEANLARRSWLLLASSWPFREAICCETWRMLKLRGRSCSWINFGDRVLRSPGVRDNIAEEMLSCWERLSSISSSNCRSRGPPSEG